MEALVAPPRPASRVGIAGPAWARSACVAQTQVRREERVCAHGPRPRPRPGARPRLAPPPPRSPRHALLCSRLPCRAGERDGRGGAEAHHLDFGELSTARRQSGTATAHQHIHDQPDMCTDTHAYKMRSRILTPATDALARASALKTRNGHAHVANMGPRPLRRAGWARGSCHLPARSVLALEVWRYLRRSFRS